MAERWNGTKWTIEKTPRSGLRGVSCTSASACTAVGFYTNGAGRGVTLAERWNGTKWVIQKTPNWRGRGPHPYGISELNGVSCTSVRACTAVGTTADGTGLQVTLAERWNGTKWAIQNIPNPADGRFGSFLNGVSCTSASDCTAVGDYFNTHPGTTSTWRSDSVRPQTPPNFAEGALVERWNGTKWVIQKTRRHPAGATRRELNGVSCRSASDCIAVGDYTTSAVRDATLAERWNGTKWVIQKTPNPAGATHSLLYGVSCTSSDCSAVGFSENSAGDVVTLAESHS